MITITFFNRRAQRDLGSSISHQLDPKISEDVERLGKLISQWLDSGWTTLVLDDDRPLLAHELLSESPFDDDTDFEVVTIRLDTLQVEGVTDIHHAQVLLREALSQLNQTDPTRVRGYRRLHDMAPQRDALSQVQIDALLDQAELRAREQARAQARGHGHEMELQGEISSALSGLRDKFRQIGILSDSKQGDDDDDA